MQDYLRGKAELSQKITEWGKRIEPLLKEQTETRPRWNIGMDGNQLLQRLDENPKNKQPIPFQETLPKKSLQPYEITRIFTSCLQLANFRNVDIINNGLNQIEFRLLDPIPHQLEEEDARKELSIPKQTKPQKIKSQRTKLDKTSENQNNENLENVENEENEENQMPKDFSQDEKRKAQKKATKKQSTTKRVDKKLPKKTSVK